MSKFRPLRALDASDSAAPAVWSRGSRRRAAAAACIFAFVINSQTTFAQAIQVVGDKVGIGTPNPATKLEVNGGSLSVRSATNTQGYVGINPGGTGYAAYTEWYRSGPTRLAYLGYQDLAGSQNNLGLNLENGANFIIGGGNIGINTALPQFRFDLNGTARLGGFTTGDTDEWPNIVWLREGNWDDGLIKGSSARSVFGRAGFGIHLHESRGFGFYSSGWNPLLNIEGGTGRLYVRGNVGLGVVNPQQRLQLGNGQYLGIMANAGSYIPAGWNRGNSGGIILASSTNADGSGWSYGSRIVSHDYGDGLGLSFDVLYAAGWTNDSLFISGRAGRQGNVGIGTINPTSKLTVNGQVKAKGFLSDTSNWADFVFQPEYQLPPLSEVESHIKAKGHLPDIPSAQEVAANGVDLTTMQVKLLQKVEELTLYAIALKKENEQARQTIQQLTARIDALEEKR